MKYLYGLALLSCVILWSSCRNDFETVASTGDLEFSRDTIYLDTIFTNIGSSTYNLKVYNRSDEDVTIPSVRLGEGENSRYRLNVDGLPGKTFEDIQVLAKDSIFIFIETTLDIDGETDALEFLYTDQIQFDTGSNQQNVELVTLVQDAVFLFPDLDNEGMVGTISLGMDEEGEEILIEGFVLDDDELTFTNEKPYVIYGYAAVGANKTLTVEPGARVHFHNNSGILVSNSASMKSGTLGVNPTLPENQVIFQGDRLEPEFENIPGQWGTIWLTSGSTDHEFYNTTIKNGIAGILMDDNDGDLTLTMGNVQIYNSSNVGLLARNGIIYGENVVINNSGQSSLSCSLGGFYTFNHSTFANYWSNSFRSFPAVTIDNIIPDVAEADLAGANFNNCIIYGSEQREISIVQSESTDLAFEFKFTNCLIKFEDPQNEFTDLPNYQFDDVDRYDNVTFNLDPVFQNIDLNNFNIEAGTSGAQDLDTTNDPPIVTLDLNGTPRVAPADSGAYEATTFPDPDGLP